MSEYDLIPEASYESLPDDAHEKFAVLVRIAQGNLARLLDSPDSSSFLDEIRSQFISTITGVAEALDIEGLPELNGDLTNYRVYQHFQIYLAGVVAKVRLRSQLVAKPHSVELGRITKFKIQQEIDKLKISIEGSDLPEKKKKALSDKLIDLEEELNKQRLSFARTMAIAASIMATVGGGTVALANGPSAADTVVRIIGLIGDDKEKEEAERLRLAPPPKALPDFSVPQQTGAPFDDLDDEVPF